MTREHPEHPTRGGTTSAPGGIAAETPPAIAELVFDLDYPITGASSVMDALQDLLDKPIEPHSHRAIVKLADNIARELSELRAQFKILFKATRTPKQSRTQAATAAPETDARPARRAEAGLAEAVKQYRSAVNDDKDLIELTERWHRLAAQRAISPAEWAKLCQEIAAVEGRLLRRAPSTGPGATAMLGVAHRLAACSEFDRDDWLGGGPVAGLIARVAETAEYLTRDLAWAQAIDAERS